MEASAGEEEGGGAAPGPTGSGPPEYRGAGGVARRRSAPLPSGPMSAGITYLTSDVHLGAVSPETEAAFRRWLDSVAPDAERIVINGDLFDFWFEYDSAIPRGYTRVLGRLASLVDAGVDVVLVGGNHDWWGGTYLREEIGVAFHQDPVVIDLGGLRTFLAHGDGLGRGDLGYRLLRLVLRGRLTRWAFRWLHPDLGAAVARRVSHTEARDDESSEAKKGRALYLERWAGEKLAEDPSLDLVAVGHTHTPVLRELEPGRWYLNSGDWLRHRSYAVLAGGGPPRLERWSG